MSTSLTLRPTCKFQKAMRNQLHPTSIRRSTSGHVNTACVASSPIAYIHHNTMKNRVDPFGYFYLTIKNHKAPISTRPVCSDCASLIHPLGKWLDLVLQPVVACQHSYFKDSFTLMQELDS